ncbi:MAG: (p)ppGpp synthetase [Acutalibacteraceae bacterium]|nr:(p)ppGpp synthetase [Acutalibacteraceae bacterium]
MKKNNTYEMNSVIQEYNEFTRPYKDAIKLVKIRLEALDSDYGHLHRHNPIHQIINRVKSLDSILNKLAKRGYPPELEYAKDYLTDIAGVRVITYYQQDVYEVVRALKSCLDIVKESDYIKKPKKSGYRSYHLIVVVPIHYLKGVEYYPVEIQIRTLTMDCWANIEHQLHYKTLQDEFSNEISEQFQRFSEELNTIGLKMEAIYSEQNKRRLEEDDGDDITLKMR